MSNQPPSTYLTPQQFQDLLGALKTGAPTGIGAPGAPSVKRGFTSGFGCGCDDMGPLSAGVYAMLAAGSPRLALAKARGVPLAPYLMNIRATFPDTTTAIVPDVGADVKIVQDTLIDAMVCRVENQSETANQNQFQSLSDFFFGFTSGIEATLTVQGAPRYDVANRFTPLSNLCDVVNGSSHWPGGWVLTYQQQLKADFIPKILLPFAPVEVIMTFRTWTPVTQQFVDMSTREALDALQTEFGIQLTDTYRNQQLAL
jgi:hypothetical protein